MSKNRLYRWSTNFLILAIGMFIGVSLADARIVFYSVAIGFLILAFACAGLAQRFGE